MLDAPAWLVLGVALHLLNQVTRACGWHAIVRVARGSEPPPARRDTVASWVAGAGAGGLVSARGGDAVRVLLLARRTPGAGYPMLAGTLVAESAGELIVGGCLLALALAIGVGPVPALPSVALPWALAGLCVSVAAVATARRSVRLRRLARSVWRGCAVLRTPGAYARRVLPWQLASRALRIGSVLCFLAAFGLPATPAAALLVLVAQGGGRLVPFAPASVGTGVALVAAGFGPVTGSSVPAGEVAAFYVATSTVLTIVGTVLAAVICLWFVRWDGLGAVIRAVRGRPVSASPQRWVS